MIISHKHRFIFIKTNKTAGTSMEIALSAFCGDNDIITPITPEDEGIRQQFGYRGPQNFQGFYNHISAREIRAQISDKIWDEYFKFCFERNPWDRVVSLYYNVCTEEPRPDMWKFIQSGVLQILKARGSGLYAMDGKIVVDRICRYENLDAELDFLQQRLDLPEIPKMPRAKGAFRKDKRHYREILDQRSKEYIEQLFADEIRLMGYQF